MVRPVKYLFLIILVGCSRESLSELDSLTETEAFQATARAEFCTLEAEQVKSKLKFVFIVDKSGSNQNGEGRLGTDPQGLRRYNAIIDFLDKAPEDSTVSYALINFSTDASSPGNLGFVDREEFTTLVKSQKYAGPCNEDPEDPLGPGCPLDAGWTSYLSALQAAKDLLKDDILEAKLNEDEIVASYYVIFHVSDGAPIIGGFPPDSYVYEETNEILNRLNSIMAIEDGEDGDYVEAIQLHSLYYFNLESDPDAILLMDEMAERGVGDFIQVNSGQEMDFTKFALPVRNIRHSLRDVFVDNLNAIWWGGEYLEDSDADFLPDLIELSLGSNPLLADTDENGVRDGIEYWAIGRPCKDGACAVSGAESFLACADLVRSTDPTTYGDIDADGLNDCEERNVLRSRHTHFDSNEDWIPDGLAFKFGIGFISGSSELNLDPDNDQVSNYQELKANTPPLFPNGSVIGTIPQEFQMRTTRVEATKSCYEVSVSNVSFKAEDDLYILYVLEGTSLIDSKRFLRTAEKSIEKSMITFTERDL